MKKLHLVVRDRTTTVFEGDVKGITSFNKKGKFDILEYHANFISLIEKNLIIHKLEGGDQEIKLDNGVLKVRENLISVYLGIKK